MYVYCELNSACNNIQYLIYCYDVYDYENM